MEKVLDVYKRPYNPMRPVVYMDESPKQLIGETRVPIPMSKGHDRKCDYEYERYEPAEAKRILDRFEFVFTPKHGSWLDMAEIELNVLNNQCLGRRIGSIEQVREEVEAWEQARNGFDKKINWQFTTKKARIKLKRLYPSYDR